MSSLDFKKSLFAKCILSGEHAVLRGCPALVVPLKKYEISMSYFSTTDYFDCQFSGPYGDHLKLLFWGLLEVALNKIGKTRNELKGKLELSSQLPLGGGLGASAAICVGIGTLLNRLDLVEDKELFEFCRSLEDQFHGESSGVDIAISFYEKAIIYERGKEAKLFEPKWEPRIYLYFSGKKGVTSECVNKVKALQFTDLDLFQSMDLQMKNSVEKCIESLLMESSEKSFDLLRKSFSLGQDCYTQWGLVPENVSQSIKKLKSYGAIECKLTGSGGGGYILSLWDESPSSEILKELIPLKIKD